MTRLTYRVCLDRETARKEEVVQWVTKQLRQTLSTLSVFMGGQDKEHCECRSRVVPSCACRFCREMNLEGRNTLRLRTSRKKAV